MRSRFVLAAAASLVAAAATARSTSVAATTFPSDDRAIVHALNRLGFGPRPGDVEKVRAMGLEQYIESQLHPDRIADTALRVRLAPLSTIDLSSREIAEGYARPAIEAKRERKNEEAAEDKDGNEPKRRDPLLQRANQVLVELSEHKVLRAIYSERQLQEVLADFWFNHFNVDARKGPDKFMLTTYERDVIRPHVLGTFRDLLGATAKSPAMLFYLDNWMSADPNRPHMDVRLKADTTETVVSGVSRTSQRPPRFVRRPLGRPTFIPQMPGGNPERHNAPRSGALGVPAERVGGAGAPGVKKGLNENYGRELMELHTLGVDGGYTQKDVTEVARAFTGWTIRNPRDGGGFTFEPRLHDAGQKVVLGHVINAGGGESDGEQVLDILAKHPSTARFIATKLARRFVSDTPPPALVDRAAARFRQTDGDLREVMHTLLMSPEFLSPEVYGAKVKTPFEFLVSSLRATGAGVQDARPLVRTLQQLGMPLYMCQPPTGYKDTADAWLNTGALVARMNFAVALTDNKLPGTIINHQSSINTLTIGGPEFQRR